MFNSRDGEWSARVDQVGKRSRRAERASADRAAKQNPPDLWLIFAPIKKARTDFIVEKAAEMGAARIVPVQTDFTNAERIRQDRLQAHAVEAAEQCGGTFVPEVAELVPLPRLLDAWDTGRRILWADRSRVGAGQHAGGAGAWPLGDPDRTRGRLFRGRTQPHRCDALGDARQPWAAHPARRRGRRRSPRPVAGGAWGLGMKPAPRPPVVPWRRARNADKALVERILLADRATSMLALDNLREHGLDGLAPRALHVWLNPDETGLVALTNNGTLLPVPRLRPGDGLGLRLALAGRVIRAVIGPDAAVARHDQGAWAGSRRAAQLSPPAGLCAAACGAENA